VILTKGTLETQGHPQLQIVRCLPCGTPRRVMPRVKAYRVELMVLSRGSDAPGKPDRSAQAASDVTEWPAADFPGDAKEI